MHGLSLEFADGFLAKLSALYLSKTYSEYLEGRFAIVNSRILANASTRMEPIWGHRPTLVIEPTVAWLSDHEGRMPHWQFFAWLESKPMDADRSWSELVVVFFCNTVNIEEFRREIASSVTKVQWSGFARDCDF